MNINAMIALLELKNIITRDEAESVVEHINSKPQSNIYADAFTAISAFVTAREPLTLGPVGPEQAAEAQRAHEAGADIAPVPEVATMPADSNTTAAAQQQAEAPATNDTETKTTDAATDTTGNAVNDSTTETKSSDSTADSDSDKKSTDKSKKK